MFKAFVQMLIDDETIHPKLFNLQEWLESSNLLRLKEIDYCDLAVYNRFLGMKLKKPEKLRAQDPKPPIDVDDDLTDSSSYGSDEGMETTNKFFSNAVASNANQKSGDNSHFLAVQPEASSRYLGLHKHQSQLSHISNRHSAISDDKSSIAIHHDQVPE